MTLYPRIQRALLVAAAMVWALAPVVADSRREMALASFLIPVPSVWVLSILIVLLIILNALFVASESAVELLTTLHVKHASSPREADRLQRLNDNQRNFVAACSVGEKVVRLGLIVVCLLLAQDVALQLFPVITYGTVLQAAAIVALPVLFINIMLGELVPSSFASLHPAAVASRLSPFIRVSSFLFSLPADFVVGLANIVARRFGGRVSFALENQAEERIKSLAESAEESGEIEADEKELLHSVFEFTDTIVREVMTPRVDLESASIDADPPEVARLVQESGHSRIPLYDGTDDRIVGIIHAKDLLLAMVEGRHVSLHELLRPVIYIPENTTLHQALAEMRFNRSQMAVVQDEYGGTAGIVTTEDIVEELVGDIVDEYDEEEPVMVKTGSGIVVDGMTHVDDLNEEFGSNFESEEFDTIGGFVFGLFGRQPDEGESISHGGYNFCVNETDGRRIQKVTIEAIDAHNGHNPHHHEPNA